jgi:Tol biopolymer transport system component
MVKLFTTWVLAILGGSLLGEAADSPTESNRPHNAIGYNEFCTNLPGGRWANQATRRAFIVQADGTGRHEVGKELIDEPNAWLSFGGWSPDGKIAMLGRGWNSPENGQWEEEHREFRMTQWQCDSYLLDLASNKLTNVSAVDRVSRCNTGLTFLPGGKKLLFTALFDGVSKVYTMDLDGHNKQNVSGESGGFIYGIGASPDGKLISYHENYQVYIANSDGSNKQRIETGNPFNFCPSWSPDGQWLLFVSGERGKSPPHIVRRDGTGLRKLADVNGYQGWVLYLDVYDFHEGSSDVPAWGKEGPWVYFTAKSDEQTTQIYRISIDGKQEQLTHSPAGSLNYQPIPSPDGKWVCFGSNRTGERQLYVMSADGKVEYPITNVPPNHGAQWPSWQPATEPSDLH